MLTHLLSAGHVLVAIFDTKKYQQGLYILSYKKYHEIDHKENWPRYKPSGYFCRCYSWSVLWKALKSYQIS